MNGIETRYTSKTTYRDYDAAKREFLGCEADYHEDTDMTGDDFVHGITYHKSVSMVSEDRKTWGMWIENRTVRVEPIYRTLHTQRMGENVYDLTVKKIGERTFEDMEFYCYGEGFQHDGETRWIHQVTTEMWEVA